MNEQPRKPTIKLEQCWHWYEDDILNGKLHNETGPARMWIGGHMDHLCEVWIHGDFITSWIITDAEIWNNLLEIGKENE
jgi:hypothetical protein